MKPTKPKNALATFSNWLAKPEGVPPAVRQSMPLAYDPDDMTVVQPIPPLEAAPRKQPVAEPPRPLPEREQPQQAEQPPEPPRFIRFEKPEPPPKAKGKLLRLLLLVIVLVGVYAALKTRAENLNDVQPPTTPSVVIPDVSGIWARGEGTPLVRFFQDGKNLTGEYAPPSGGGLRPITDGTVDEAGRIAFTAVTAGRKCRFTMTPEADGYRLCARFDFYDLVDGLGRGQAKNPREFAARQMAKRQLNYARTEGEAGNDLGVLTRVP